MTTAVWFNRTTKCPKNIVNYFKGRNFRGSGKPRNIYIFAKYLHFAGINFRGEALSKDFTGIKKGKNLNL